MSTYTGSNEINGVPTPWVLNIHDDGPYVSDGEVVVNGEDTEQYTTSSIKGVRIVLDADTDNIDEQHTARHIYKGDGGDINGIIGHTGSSGKGADGETLDGALSNSLCIHHPGVGERIMFGVNDKVYLSIDSAGNGEIHFYGEGAFNSGIALCLGDGNTGVVEHIDDSMRAWATSNMEIATNSGAVVIGKTGDLKDTVLDDQWAFFSNTIILMNAAFEDKDFIIRKSVSGEAYAYIAGADAHAFSGNMGFFDTTPAAQPANITNPTGGATVDAEARTAIDSILSALETLGLTAT